ncbi:MAG TPA: type II secretion system F family protein [Roseiflexaceae bacterium]|nr:type II secretion system F family protein [Roseiflexaceae bacterium]
MALMILVSVLASLSLMLLVGGIALTRRDATVSERLGTYMGSDEETVVVTNLTEQKPFSERVLLPIIRRVSGIFRWILPQNQYQELRARLIMAGNPSGISAIDFVGIKGLCMTLVLLLLLAVGFLTPLEPNFFKLALFCGITVVSFFIPDIWLSSRITSRQNELIASLPDALDLLAIASAAGLSFENAMQEITTKWSNEIAREFDRVLRDISMGLSRRQALTDLGTRTGVSDIISFASAIKQAEALGVSIGRVLTIQAEELRTKRRQRAQERANQAPVKMMFPLVFLIFPAIFAVLLGPAIPDLLAVFN